jgi:hypothetical protein
VNAASSHRIPGISTIVKIISGGQTGADRAALDFAIAHGIPHGGWCPLGRLAEDGVIAARYRLTETPAAEYAQRSEWNVRDADGTVILSIAKELSGGSKFTAEIAVQLGKPCLHLAREAGRSTAAAKLRDFIERHRIQCLNIAGPRASSEPQVGDFVFRTLQAALVSADKANPSSGPR